MYGYPERLPVSPRDPLFRGPRGETGSRRSGHTCVATTTFLPVVIAHKASELDKRGKECGPPFGEPLVTSNPPGSKPPRAMRGGSGAAKKGSSAPVRRRRERVFATL